jgi:hypothetical protein
MGQTIKDIIDWLCEPTRYFLGSFVAIALVLKFRSISTKPILITGFFVLGSLLFAWAWQDPNFHKIVTKPDNVPIIILLGSVIYFSWLSLRRGY